LSVFSSIFFVLPGPDGTPLTPVVPAPAEPAAGVPAF
jgi:hypothetical protein